MESGMSKEPRLILASGSARRQDLLRGVGLEFEVRVSLLDENTDEQDPVRLVQSLSQAKAREVARLVLENSASKTGETIVLGADTVVVLDRSIMGKPACHDEALSMLLKLSGRTHSVFTGVTLLKLPQGIEEFVYEESKVHFRKLSEAEAKHYAMSEEPMDKAGAYAVQGAAGAFVERIEGCLSNIIGLPLSATCLLLRRHGISVLGQNGEHS